MSEDPFGDTTVPTLALHLLRAGMAQTAATTQQLLDSLQRDIDRRDAELALIRAEIEQLCSSPMVPNPAWIVAALWPNHVDVQVKVDQMKEEGS